MRLLNRDNWCEGGEREVDTRERHQVGLELVQVDVQGAVETERGSDRRDNLSDETVQVGEAWRGDTETLLANVVDGLIVDLRAAHLSVT